MRILTTDMVKRIHYLDALEFHTSTLIRDEGLLDSSVNGIYQSFAGIEFYPTIIEKAARLGYSLSCNHPFIDGNKRTAYRSMKTFLLLNGYEFHAETEEALPILLDLADHKVEYDVYLEWVRSKTYVI